MNEAIRKEMQKAMKKLGYTQESLARELGVTQGMVWQYLSGHRAKVPQAFQKMLDALGLELVAREKEDK